MEAAQEQIRHTYLESRQRYIEYYLEYSKECAHLVSAMDEEMLNLQQAFQSTLKDGQYQLVPEFWRAVSDFFWDHGYWLNYLEWGEGVLKAAKQLNKRETEAWVLSELGWLRMEQGEFALSKELLDRANIIFDAIKHNRGKCTVERYLGVLAYRIGDFEIASKHCETALQVAISESAVEQSSLGSKRGTEETDYTLTISEIRNLQGSLAKRKGDLAQARQYL